MGAVEGVLTGNVSVRVFHHQHAEERSEGPLRAAERILRGRSTKSYFYLLFSPLVNTFCCTNAGDMWYNAGRQTDGDHHRAAKQKVMIPSEMHDLRRYLIAIPVYHHSRALVNSVSGFLHNSAVFGGGPVFLSNSDERTGYFYV